MRNLKKFLALVLAMMMAFSLLATVNAADVPAYTDASSVTAKYKTAIDVVSGLGIMRGTSTTSDVFNPTKSITRAEMAAIAYRVMTADVGDENVGLYANMTTPFTDVGNKWWTLYINYAWNAQIIVGDGNGHFFTDMEINGYQVLAILPRMIGYNQPGEFEGKGWELHTAQIAAQLHVSDGLTSALSAKTPGSSSNGVQRRADSPGHLDSRRRLQPERRYVRHRP